MFLFSRALTLPTPVSKARLEEEMVQCCLRIKIIQNLAQYKPDQDGWQLRKTIIYGHESKLSQLFPLYKVPGNHIIHYRRSRDPSNCEYF